MNDFSENSSSQPSKADDLLQSLFRAATMSSRQSIKPRASDGPAPLSASQQQMWFLNQLNPDSPVYNTFRAFYLKGRLDLTVLKDCIHEIVGRHDALRTVFQLMDGIPVQVVQPDMGFDFSLKDLSGIDDLQKISEGQPRGAAPTSAQKTKLYKLLVAEARKTFDLPHGPCLRVSLFKLNKNEYCFQLVMHHIVCDGWSLSMFFSELASLYEAFSHGKASPLEELPIQYPDYAVWQQEWLQSDEVRPHVDYWMDHLNGSPRNLNLPVNYRRPSVQSFRGGTENFIIPEQLTDRLKKFSSQEGATLFMTLLAAYQVLLYRYSGQTDIVTGSPIANRNHPETHDMVGCFVNTLALRTDLTGSPGFRELLSRVRVMTLDAYAHQDLPFQVLVEKVQSSRDMTFSPLFQTSFVLQNTPELVREFAGLTFKLLDIDSKTAKFDLTLVLTEDEGRLTGEFEYSVDLFEAGTIRNLIQHFQMLLESILADPDRPISELSFLTEEEKHRQLVEWNDTSTDYPGNKCIHELFEEQVQRSPDSTAVIFDGQKLSYGELNGKANQLAHYLMSQGVGPEVLVGICIERSLEMAIGILAILKAGGAYVPLDPSYPRERLEFMIKGSELRVLLTQKRLLEKLPQSTARVISLDTLPEDNGSANTKNPDTVMNPENLAYVMYTSGSTGTPKGIMVPHKALCNNMLWVQETFSLNHSDRILQKSPFSFDASVWEFYSPLISGACLIMALPERHLDISYLTSEITENQISIIQVVPSLLQLLLEEGVIGACTSLKHVFCGGEALSPALVEKFMMQSDADLINLYGPTETCINATYWKLDRDTYQGTVPIGRPVANTYVFILDRSLQPVPVGAVGELHVGGDPVGRGYINQPQLTAERFIDNPFRREPGARLYKTGDQCRYLQDGSIAYIGRIDNQINIRGYRIEPGEIESAMSQYPDVRNAIVTVYDNTSGDKHLTGYVLFNENSEGLINELKQWLKNKLPDYMVPSAFVSLDSFPLMPNGKVDRKSLPAPFASHDSRNEPVSPPHNPIEEQLIDIWKRILKNDRISVTDDFFDLGGHSLLAMQIIAWVRRDLQVEVSIHDVFEYSTVSGLAQIIAGKKG